MTDIPITGLDIALTIGAILLIYVLAWADSRIDQPKVDITQVDEHELLVKAEFEDDGTPENPEAEELIRRWKERKCQR
jgi:hypothetical protein